VANVLIHTEDRVKIKTQLNSTLMSIKVELFKILLVNQVTVDTISYMDKDPLPNCPIMKEHLISAKDIREPNLGLLKGKPSRKTLSK